MTQTTGYIAFLFSLLFCSCGNKSNGDKVAFINQNKKEVCTVCKSPSSRTFILQNADKKSNAANASSNNKDMVFIKGGTFAMGSDAFNDSKPVHTVTVSNFYMDEHEVTNAQFAQFVKATGYVTVAERAVNAADYPDVPASALVLGSAVFMPPSSGAVSLSNPTLWWRYVGGASWKHPLGPKSNIAGEKNMPVVQVCFTDAAAYAKWAGKRLPTEAEWEYAARAGKAFANFYWGIEKTPHGKWMANIFEGSFPWKNTAEDGFAGIAPVKSFSPNAFGLYDMEGNVWEWCSDLYRPDYYAVSPAANPKGPVDSYDADEPNVEKHVQRGGSFLCSDNYCNRYKAGSRGKGETTSAGNNLGFRCVKGEE